MHRSFLLLSMLAALTAACRHTSAAEPSAPATQQPPPELTQHAGHTSAAAQAAAAQKPPAQRPEGRVHYDLAAHVERAEIREGQSLVVNLGELGGAKYTLGGWLTGASGRARVGDGPALLVRGKQVKLALPADAAGAATLELSLRGFRPGPLTVYVNGETLLDAQLSGKDFETVSVPVGAEVLKAGENALQLRVGRTGPAPVGGDAGLAIRWLRLTPSGSEPSQEAPASEDALAPEGAAELALPAGYRLGYTMEIAKDTALRADVAAGAGAELRVTAVRDGKPPISLFSGTGGRLDAELSRLAGEVTRIELEAAGGEVKLKRPRVVQLEEPRELAPLSPVKNVVVILVDTLRADKLSPYNDKTAVKTPGLSTFLRDAAVMQNARSNENWTKPSVATLLSSLLPWQHNAVTGESKVPDAVELLPELLRKRGFFTGSFIANGYVSDKFGFKQGWHTYRNYIREGRRTSAQYVAADVLEWLDARPKDKPFFLYVHTIDPHVPYKPPQHFLSMYDDEPYDGVVNFRQTNELLEKIKIGSIKLGGRDKRRLEALYDAEISYHDAHFAALLEGLDKRGLADDTMVVVTSDHGEEFWDHGSVGHGHSVYDELLHVPLMVRIPGLTQGRSEALDAVALVDVMPTILEALGQELPDGLAGNSFLSQLRGEGAGAPRAAVSGFMRTWRTLGVGRYKLIQRNIGNYWLYDVEADAGETKDLAGERPIALRYARGLLGLSLERASGETRESPERAKPKQKPRVHKRENTTIDAETEAQLRALGYVGSSKR